MRFRDRVDAGRRLAAALTHLRREDVLVLGLPRGGLPVALEVARTLHAPLDVMVVRKLGTPYQEELAMGAISEDGVRILNDDVIRLAGVTPAEVDLEERRERVELERRAARFRGSRTRHPLKGRTVVVVDDGLATGATARAACTAARLEGAARVVLAVPVAPHDWMDDMGDVADEYIALSTPAFFAAVGQFYEDFSQITDDQVVECLHAADADRP